MGNLRAVMIPDLNFIRFGRLPRMLFLAVMLLYPCRGDAQFFPAEENQAVHITGTPEDEKRVGGLVRRCRRVMDEILGESDTQRKVRIVVGDGSATQLREENLTLRLHSRMDDKQVVPWIIQGLLLARCQVGAKDSPEGVPVEKLEWVIAALSYEVLYVPRRAGRRYRPSYRALQRAFCADHYPHLTKMLGLHVSVDNHLLYRLYSLHCHFFLHLIASSQSAADRKAFLRDVLTSIVRGATPGEAVTALLQDQDVMDSDETLQQWYEDRALKFSLRGRACLDVAEVHRRLKRLRRVQVRRPRASGSVEHSVVRLENLPALIQEEGVAPVGLGSLIRDFHWLAREAPPFLRSALLQYVTALSALEHGREKAFRNTLRKAQRLYSQQKRKHEKVEEFLDSVEEEHLSVEERFPFLLQALPHEDQFDITMKAALGNFLDRVEQEMETDGEGASQPTIDE